MNQSMCATPAPRLQLQRRSHHRRLPYVIKYRMRITSHSRMSHLFTEDLHELAMFVSARKRLHEHTAIQDALDNEGGGRGCISVYSRAGMSGTFAFYRPLHSVKFGDALHTTPRAHLPLSRPAMELPHQVTRHICVLVCSTRFAYTHHSLPPTMPIELPQMSDTCAVPVPNQPGDPPSVHDFGRAIRFGHDLVLGHLQGKVSETDPMSGSTYATKILLVAAGGQREQPADVNEPPPWFANAIRDLKDELKGDIRTAKQELKADVQTLTRELLSPSIDLSDHIFSLPGVTQPVDRRERSNGGIKNACRIHIKKIVHKDRYHLQLIIETLGDVQAMCSPFFLESILERSYVPDIVYANAFTLGRVVTQGYIRLFTSQRALIPLLLQKMSLSFAVSLTYSRSVSKMLSLVGVTYSESQPKHGWRLKEPTNNDTCVKKVLTAPYFPALSPLFGLTQSSTLRTLRLRGKGHHHALGQRCVFRSSNLLQLERCILRQDNGDYFFLYSGHSFQREDIAGVKEDRREEYIIPCDPIHPSDSYIIEEKITGEVLNTTLVKRLRKGCRLLVRQSYEDSLKILLTFIRALVDSHHSGTLLSASSPLILHDDRPLIKDPQVYAINIVIEQEISGVPYVARPLFVRDVGFDAYLAIATFEPTLLPQSSSNLFDHLSGNCLTKTIREIDRSSPGFQCWPVDD
ncbi:unnamed protein product [Cyclocybe aegerita]|uniref:Uncharacterized protein n=1 Tax=Cyclocybe aegerita TaxID=1973307 RepID=A0A8S0VU00_CYCAE|nr:unnamed protein product [Cyclocybe aegerita]